MPGKDKHYTDIRALTDNPYLNLYEMDAVASSGVPFHYYFASRRKGDRLRICTGQTDPEGVLVYAVDALVNMEMVRSGSAWVYTRYCAERGFCARLKQAEAEAKSARAGLWREPKPEPPWRWRREHPQTGRR